MARLGEALKVNSVLVSLDLRSNKINSVGAALLGDALKVNSTLTALNLTRNEINLEGVAAFFSALTTNATLVALDLQENKVPRFMLVLLNELVGSNILLSPTTSKAEKRATFLRLFSNKTLLPFKNRSVLNSTNILYFPFQQFPYHFTSIDFRNNPQLTIIPPNLGYLDPQFTKSIRFDVPNLLPSMRPFAKNASTIIQYAKSMLDGTLVRLNQVKLMVVGRAATGKTTLVRRFYGEKYNASLQSTDGIDLGDFTYQGMKFSTWDFGGQKVYRYTHQLFLGDNTIYLLLFKLTDPLASTLSEMRFWMNSISARTKNPTLILVGTHLDQARKHKIHTKKLIASILQTLNQEYPTLITHADKTPVYRVCGVPGGEDTIAPLLTHLVNVAQHVQLKAPKIFSVAEAYFSQLSHLNPPVIAYNEAMAALQQRLSDQTTQEIHSTLTMLADFGSISVFHQPRTPTEGMIVLRPQWITTLFASIITTHHTFVGSDSGTISRDVITQHIWRDTAQYPPDKHDQFLHVLTELQVIFPFVERNQLNYFIPCRLREEPPDLSYHLTPRMFADHPVTFQRVFKLAASAVPIAVIPPLLIELLRKGELVVRWQQGGVARVVEAHGQSVWIHVWRSAAHSISLHLWGQSIKVCAPWLRSLSMLLANRLKEFYHIAYDTLIPCSECDREGNEGFFAQSTIHHAILKEHNLVACGGEAVQHLLRVDHLAPDMLYHDLNDDGFIFDFDHFEEIKVLGSGASGKVYLMSLTLSEDELPNYPTCSSSLPSIKPTQYAVKVLQGDATPTDQIDFSTHFTEFKREVFLMSTLDHPFILRLFGICTSPLAMVMEVAGGGDLYAQLNDPIGIQSKVFHFAAQVKLQLAEYVSSRQNIHRALYIIEKSAFLPPEFLLVLKISCKNFLRIHTEMLRDRGIDVNLVVCPIKLLLQLKEADPRDHILESLQFVFNQDHLGLDQGCIEKYYCPHLPPLESIGNADAFQNASRLFDDWKSLADRRGVDSNQIELLSDCFFNSLHRIHENPSGGLGYNLLDIAMDQINSLEKEQRWNLVPISFPLQLKLAAEIVLALVHLHGLQPPMVHRDLKSLNIYLTRSLIDFPLNDPTDAAWKIPLVKVADFGLSVRMARSGHLQVRDRNDNDPLLNINPTWAAPELLRGEQYTSSIDVYAVGIVLWELLMRDTPFHEIPMQDILRENILQGYRPFVPPSVMDQPEYTQYLQLMRQCWSHHPDDRPSMNEVYQRLMSIIESHESARFLKELLPSIQSLGGQEEAGLPRQPFQIHPIDIPLPSLQVETKDDLPHITCIIAPYQTEEFWFGFANGVVANAKYVEQSFSLDVLACFESDRHPSRVNAVVYCVGQGEHGTVWTGSEDGLLSVWSSQREGSGAGSESASFKSHFLIFSDRKLKLATPPKPLRRNSSRVSFTSLRAHWVEFEYGHLSVFASQSKVQSKFQLSWETDVSKIHFESETQQIHIFLQQEDQHFILSAAPGDSASNMKDYYQIMTNVFASLHADQPVRLKRLTSRQFLQKQSHSKIGIQSLLALDHTVFCATHDFFISEWTIASTVDAHGLHETFSLEPRRSFQLEVISIEPRLRVLLDFVRVNQRTVWLAVGDRWFLIDLYHSDPDPPLNSHSTLHPLSTKPIASKMSPQTHDVSSPTSLSGNKVVSMLLVREPSFDQIYTGDESGDVIVWHPKPQATSDASDIAPFLVPIQHRVISPTFAKSAPPNNLQTSPVDTMVYISPNHVWFGSQSELTSWNLSTHARDEGEYQPFLQFPQLRPGRQITGLVGANDSRGSAVVWCLSREKRFLRFSGLKGLYHAYQEPISAEFVVEVEHLSIDQQLHIGAGGFGKVYCGVYFNQPVAIKMLNHGLNTAALTREISSWCTFRHPHLVTLIGYATRPDALIVMELMDCSLFDVLYKEIGGAPPGLRGCIKIARGIASGLSYIHARQAVHQDLKSLNVLLRGYHPNHPNQHEDAQFEVKIADFGATKPIDMMDESAETVMSLCWTAPELFTSYATTASDVYAMGMVFYELFMRELPFKDILVLETNVSKLGILNDELCQQQRRPTMSAERMGLSVAVAQPIIELIAACWKHEPYLRPTAAYVSHQLNQNAFTRLESATSFSSSSSSSIDPGNLLTI